jgi:hypothetical protein
MVNEDLWKLMPDQSIWKTLHDQSKSVSRTDLKKVEEASQFGKAVKRILLYSSYMDKVDQFNNSSTFAYSNSKVSEIYEEYPLLATIDRSFLYNWSDYNKYKLQILQSIVEYYTKVLYTKVNESNVA